MEKKYILQTPGGGYVGLFNYGRTYQVAKRKTTITATYKAAKLIANTFKATIKEA